MPAVEGGQVDVRKAADLRERSCCGHGPHESVHNKEEQCVDTCAKTPLVPTHPLPVQALQVSERMRRIK